MKAICGVFSQASGNDGRKVRWHIESQRVDLRCFDGGVGDDQHRWVVVLKWNATSQQVETNDGQRIQVAASVRLLTACLFRAHESRRALQSSAGAADQVVAETRGANQTKVQQFRDIIDVASFRQKNVAWFHVSMDKTATVGFMKCPADLSQDMDDSTCGLRSKLFDQLPQI